MKTYLVKRYSGHGPSRKKTGPRVGSGSMRNNMSQLARLSRTGLPSFGIQKMCLPLTIHSQYSTPAAFVKYSRGMGTNIYSMALSEGDFIERCRDFK